MTIQILVDDLRDLERSLKRIAQAPVAEDIAEELSFEWITRSRRQVGVDTGQLKARTRVRSVSGTPSRATAWLEADTPYAGFHEYGNSHTAPNRFWRDGRGAAERLARRAHGAVHTELRRSLESGGTWTPRRGWIA